MEATNEVRITEAQARRYMFVAMSRFNRINQTMQCTDCADGGWILHTYDGGYYLSACKRCDNGRTRAEDIERLKLARLQNDSSQWELV